MGIALAPRGLQIYEVAVLPDPEIWRVGQVLSGTASALRFQMRDLEPDATGGAPNFPLKGSGYSFRLVCT